MSTVTRPELALYVHRIGDLCERVGEAEWTTPAECRALLHAATDLAAAALTLRARLRLYIDQMENDDAAAPGGH